MSGDDDDDEGGRVLAIVVADELLDEGVGDKHEVQTHEGDADNLVETESHRGEDGECDEEHEEQKEAEFGMWRYHHGSAV